MDHFDRPMSRRALIRAGALGAIGAYAVGASGLADTALGARKVQVGGTTLNWLTWSDHYFTNQVQKVKNSTKIGAHIQLISDDADAYTRVKQGGSQWDMSSEDALWVPLFYKQGLIQALDLTELPVSKQLYSVARQVPFWKAGSNQMGYPFGWSSLQVYYNPKNVTTKPDSWHALIDPKYKGKIVVENQPTDLMAMSGLATGAKSPYNMTPAEISRAKQFLEKFKPNVLKLVSQNTEVVNALADGSAWLGDREPRHRRARQGRRRAEDRRDDHQGRHLRLDGRRDADEGLEERRRVHEVHQHHGAGSVDRAELPQERPAAVQREGVQAARQPGPQGAG